MGASSATQNRLPSRAVLEKAFRQSDSSFDGVFFVGVRSTNVFCRPSCTARKPLLRNVIFFATAADALFAGFRPCKRCRPLNIGDSHPEWAKRLLASVDGHPERKIYDRDLQKMGIEPARARRYFKKHYGLTFQAYSRARRMGIALSQVREGAPLDDVVLGFGYSSHSGFRDAFKRAFRLPPGKSRERDCIVVSMMDGPLGPMILGATREGLCLAEFADRRMFEREIAELRHHLGCAMVPGTNSHIQQAERELREYFDGKRTEFTVPLVTPGSAFDQKVWRKLRTIPFGRTLSYLGLAQRVGDACAARAVGNANGRNRISIIIPCHRVTNKNGRLGGYGGGLWRKQWLLNHEDDVVASEAPQANAA
jgi:AraC family transcriptional regulator of adaptative response/methylated-DNA-[protein]-cysteine methyltransferase